MTGGAFAYNFVELTRNLTTSAGRCLQRFRVDFHLRLGVRALLICEMPLAEGREL